MSNTMSSLMSPDDQYFAEQEDGDLAEVPPGATPEGVRDDVDIKISKGELVIPEDVARWHGLKWFMAIRAEAKEGLAAMAAEGLIKRPEGTVAASEMPPMDGLMSPMEELYDDEDEFSTGGMADPATPDASDYGFDSFAEASPASMGIADTSVSLDYSPNEEMNAISRSYDAARNNSASFNDRNTVGGFLGSLAGGRAEPMEDPTTGLYGTGFSRNQFQGPASVVGYATGIPGLGRAVGWGTEALGFGRENLGFDPTNSGLQGAIDSGVTGFGYAGTDINSDINGDDTPTAYSELDELQRNRGIMSWPLLA